MWDKFLFGFVAILASLRLVQSQCTNQQIGMNNGADQDDSATVGQGYVMTDTQFEISCCGVITEWTLTILGSGGVAQDLVMQVLRPPTSGSVYAVVGENTIPVTQDETNTFPIAAGNRISVRAGDTLGWTKSLVAYKSEGASGKDGNLQYPISGYTGTTVDTSVVTSIDDRSYGVRVTTGPGSIPTLTCPDVTISNTEAVGTVITTIVANDADAGDIPELVLSSDAGNSADFQLNTTTGDVTIISGPPASTVTLTYRVTDPCGSTDTCTMTVTIVNPAPVFSGPYSSNFTVGVNDTIERKLFDVNVADPGDTVTCTFTYDATAYIIRTQNSVYTISARSGAGYTNAYVGTDTITASCSDAVNTVTQTYNVEVYENQNPYFTNLDNTINITSTQATDESIFQALGVDPEGNTQEMSLACISPAATPCPFIIGDDGYVKVTDALANANIATYDISITVQDDYNTAATTRTLTINILDINQPPVITNGNIQVTINENNLAGALVTILNYTDPDAGQTHTWNLVATPASALFSISADGVITVSDSVNYETLAADSYNLSITLYDPVTSDSTTVGVTFLDVNEGPVFASDYYTISFDETDISKALGTPSLVFSDEDVADSHTLAMTCPASVAGYLLMDANTGEISSQAAYDVDPGVLPLSVTCNVTVTDAGGLTDTAQLDIFFTNINDNTPSFSSNNYVFHIGYYDPADTVVGCTPATDADLGLFGTIVGYRIDQSSLSVPHFKMDASGCIIIVTPPQSFGSALNASLSYNVQVIAEDGGGQTVTSDVTIIIGPVSTTTPTTTTYRYITFFEDVGNWAWFIPLMIISLIALLFVTWLCWTCRGEQGCGAFWRKLRGRMRGQPRPYYREERPRPVEGSVRQPPPPQHQWQREPPPPIEPPQLKVAMVRVARPVYAPTMAPTMAPTRIPTMAPGIIPSYM